MSDDRQDLRVKAAASISLSLKPILGADGTVISHVHVAMRIRGLELTPGEALIQMPLLFDNFETTARSIADLEVTDSGGSVPVLARDHESTGSANRTWIATRPVSGEVSIHYSIAVHAISHSLGAAPPLELRSEGCSFSGGGVSLIALPASLQLFEVDVNWNLTGLPPGAKGITTFGEGRACSQTPISLAQLKETYFMAGAVGHYSDGAGFFGAWQGTPPYDAKALLHWSNQLYDGYKEFFGVRSTRTLGVFLRRNPVNAGGGREGYRSFVVTYGHGMGNNAQSMRFVISHEMFHTFSPMLNRPRSAAENFRLVDRWFSEGLAVFYAGLLPLRLGLIGDAEYVNDLNFYAGRYYTSDMMRVPNADLPLRYWADTRVRTLAYDRGMLYFASVDCEVRRTTGNRYSLDDIVRELRAREEDGRTIDNGDWEEQVRLHLGAPGIEQFRAFLAGTPPLPASEAFGARFRRVSRPLRRYELGFDPQVLAEKRRVVRGIVAGSEAQRAGLSNGDRIVEPVPQDLIQGTQDMRIHLRVERGHEQISISYLPRGGFVDAYQWELIA